MAALRPGLIDRDICMHYEIYVSQIIFIHLVLADPPLPPKLTATQKN